LKNREGVVFCQTQKIIMKMIAGKRRLFLLVRAIAMAGFAAVLVTSNVNVAPAERKAQQ